jgi:hypothetical protein
MITFAPGLTDIHQELLANRDKITAAVRPAIEVACGENTQLRRAASILVDADPSQECVFRLLPFAVTGRDATTPLLVGVISRVWWAGAETFDDLTDRSFDADALGLSRTEALLTSTACITLLPLAILRGHDLPSALELGLSRELTDTSLHAANGQLDDVSGSSDSPLWPRVVRSYVGKSGAPYGRDLAMTALLNGEGSGEVRAWRLFGQLFGMLRQMTNDRYGLSAPDNEDFRNGTRTLLLANAADCLPAVERADLIALHAQARHCADARQALLQRLTSAEVAATYDGRVRAVHEKLSVLLSQLLVPSDRRDLAQWMITSSAVAASLGSPEAAGAH